MNQALVWGKFSEFFLFLRPFINMTKIRNYIKRVTTKMKKSTLPLNFCQICHNNGADSYSIQIPYSVQPCGHIFCYYCISGAVLLDSKLPCARCGVPVEGIKQELNI
jgi:hypothetical protein